MHSQQKNKNPRSFKIRIALFSLTSTVILLSATFYLSLLMLNGLIRKDQIARSNNISSFLEDSYIGRPKTPASNQLSIAQWPSKIKKAFFEQYPNIQVGAIEKESLRDGQGYEVIASTGTQRLEILISETARTWTTYQETMEQVIAEMNTLLAPTLSDGSIANISVLILDSKGQPLTPHDANLFPDIVALHNSAKNKTPIAITRENGLYNARSMYDGNTLCIAYTFPRNAPELQHWKTLFAALFLIFIPAGIMGGQLLSKRVMTGVKEVAEAAQEFDAKNAFVRVQSRGASAEIEELRNSFNGMAERIEQLVQELRAVTINIAHDIRTPITRIKGLIETADWKNTSKQEHEEICNMILTECNQLSPLITDMLDMARAETGLFELQHEPIDLKMQLQTAIDIFTPSANDKNINIRWIAPDVPVHISADCGKIQRVIANLLDNAIKYTPLGGDISIELEQTNEHTEFKVRDTGPGIGKLDQNRVFERFYRCDSSRTVPGNGLGLSLAKAFIHNHNGKIWIQPNTPKGCIVIVQIPRESDSEAPSSSIAISNTRSPSKR